MATYQSGGVRKATANTRTAMRRSAESRQCPSCGRKSALKRDPDLRATYCRWSLETRTVTSRNYPNSAVAGTRVVSMCDYYRSWDENDVTARAASGEGDRG